MLQQGDKTAILIFRKKFPRIPCIQDQVIQREGKINDQINKWLSGWL